MKKILPLVFALAFFVAAVAVAADSNPPEFASPADAARYREVIAELRCLVCQNQNLADSNADLARDMRGVVAKMIREGESAAAVAEFMTARYGDFVLYRPPFRPSTWLLWLGPAALLLLGAFALMRIVRAPRRAEIREDEKKQAAKILESESESEPESESARE